MAVLDTIRGAYGHPTIGRYNAENPEHQKKLNELAEIEGTRLEWYRIFEQYYDNEQGTQLLDRAKLYLEASGFRFCENFCETIVDVHADRLKVERFEVEDNEDATDWLNDVWWTKNRMDDVQGTVHTETLKLGDGCLIADFDAERGIPVTRWNNPDKLKFCYTDDSELDCIVKVWSSNAVGLGINPERDPIRRMNLYYEDRIEKWYTKTEGTDSIWFYWADEEDVQLDEGSEIVTNPATALPAMQWPVWWTEDQTEEGEPLGLAGTHFRHKAKGKKYGRSLLRGVVPQQDQLNKQVLDLFYVMDTQGWKQRWAAGIGDADTLKVAIGEWVVANNAEAKFGEFDAEDPAPLQEIIEGTLRRMSARTRTPLHELDVGTQPSGEARKTAESGVVKATEDRQVPFGNAWEDQARIAWKLADAFGSESENPDAPKCPKFDPDAKITIQWASPEIRNEQQDADIHETELRMGVVSKQTVAEERGYDWDQEKERMKTEAAEAPNPLDPLMNPDAALDITKLGGPGGPKPIPSGPTKPTLPKPPTPPRV